MLGLALYHIHKALYAVGPAISDWFATPSSDPVIQSIQSRQHYDRFQAGFKKRIADARAKHGKVREIERERYDHIHSALGLRR